MNKRTDLTPLPCLCGKVPRVQYWGRYQIQCSNPKCLCMPHTLSNKRRRDIVRAWNRWIGGGK